MGWAFGEVVEHRHLCGDRVWGSLPTRVVSDTPDLLVTYTPSGAPVTYVPGPWPTATGEHPWHPTPAWSGHGVLMLQRPGDPYGAWVFWAGPARAFACWYLNIHEFSRGPDWTAIRDLELDVVVPAGGPPRLKDEEYVDVRVAEGRLTVADAALARAVAADVVGLVERGETWWDRSWESWAPPPGWDAVTP